MDHIRRNTIIAGILIIAGMVAGFRIIASALVIIGTIILVSILALSKEYLRLLPPDPSNFEALGYLLKSTRDLINHVFMILILCIANMLLYIHMIKTKLSPLWLSGLHHCGIHHSKYTHRTTGIDFSDLADHKRV